MKSAFTIATGRQTYKKMAINCARSFARWNDLPFFIYSDEELELPADLKNVSVRVMQPGEFGIGFSTKLHLDRFCPTNRSLFIDADCLVMGDLEPLFAACAGTPVGVLGYLKSDGEMFGDVRQVCAHVGVDALPHFNGGLYYVEQGHASAAIFDEARALEPRYDEIGLVRLRGQPNDEVLISIALAKAGVKPVANDGGFYADFQWWPEVERIDALKGEAIMRNPPAGSPGHQDRYPSGEAKPLVVHFLGHHVEGNRYREETLALLLSRYPLPARLIAALAVLPARAVDGFKELFRPLFHRLFGARKIRKSASRLVLD